MNRTQNKNHAETTTTKEESTSHPLRRQAGVNPLALFQFEVENLRRQLTEAVQYAEQVVDTVYTNYVKSTRPTTGVDGRNEAAENNFWANIHLEDADHRGPEQQPNASQKKIQEDQTSVRTPPEPHRQLLGHVYASNNQEIKPVYYHPLEQEVAQQEGASASVADESPTTSRRHDSDADVATPADKSSATEIPPAAASTTDVSHYFFLRPYVGSTVTKWNIKCKNVWVWKIATFVMHILHDS
ncbi:unnamed protein product [Amoebophrya sp. A120]|nr:unnamed protein product [Amoebophrya sp. A120]|eukprot:GSA120T00026433001.1